MLDQRFPLQIFICSLKDRSYAIGTVLNKPFLLEMIFFIVWPALVFNFTLKSDNLSDAIMLYHICPFLENVLFAR